MNEKEQKSAQTKAYFDKESLQKWGEDIILPTALTAVENVELLKKYKETGDIKIRNQLVCGNLRFAVSFSYKYFRNLIFKLYANNVDDLVQDLSLCLMRAVEKFDFSRANSFCTFVKPVIKSTF